MTPADAGTSSASGAHSFASAHGVKQFNLASLEQTLNLFTRFAACGDT